MRFLHLHLISSLAPPPFVAFVACSVVVVVAVAVAVAALSDWQTSLV